MVVKLQRRQCVRCNSEFQPKTGRVLHCNQSIELECESPECSYKFITKCSAKPSLYCSRECSTSSHAVNARNTHQFLQDHSLWKEVDRDLNDLKTVAVLPINRSIDVWWRGSDCGHQWRMRVSVRSAFNTGCPFCGNRKVLTGFNDVATCWPLIAKEWDYENNRLTPEETIYTHDKPVSWLCPDYGHRWEAKPKDRVRFKDPSCPYCSDRQVLTGFNDLATCHPDLMKEWDWEKNSVNPYEIRAGIVYWKCSKNHSFKMSINDRFKRNRNCNVCSGRVLLSGFNDLKTIHPNLVSRWSSKNLNTPDYQIAKTTKLFLWNCDKGHEYSYRIYQHSKNPEYCPFCSNTAVEVGFNDFASQNPTMAEYWADSTLRPDEVLFGSNKIVKWSCQKCSILFDCKINDQMNRTSSLCKLCRKSYSYLETTVEKFLIERNINYEARKLILRKQDNSKLQLDFILPSKLIAIEVQDFATHSKESDEEPTDDYWKKRHILVKRGPTYHALKKKLTKEQLGFKLIEIWEDEIRDGSFKARLDATLSTKLFN